MPVSGTALQAFFTAQGQSINVSAGQLDYQSFSLPVQSVFQVQQFGSPPEFFGAYSAGQQAPALCTFPGETAIGWQVLASFRDAPARLIVNLFDNHAAIVSTNTYLGLDRSNLGFCTQGAAGTFYTQDARNTGAAARILVFNATGALAGSTWFACETGPGPGGDFADTIALVGFAAGTAPVPAAHTSWGRVKALYH